MFFKISGTQLSGCPPGCGPVAARKEKQIGKRGQIYKIWRLSPQIATHKNFSCFDGPQRKWPNLLKTVSIRCANNAPAWRGMPCYDALTVEGAAWESVGCYFSRHYYWKPCHRSAFKSMAFFGVIRFRRWRFSRISIFSWCPRVSGWAGCWRFVFL